MGRKNAPNAPTVSAALWHELYEAARQFQIMAPWDWMEDAGALGISNQFGTRLLCVLGAMGEVFGLASYQGDQGSRVFLDLIHGRSPRDPEFLFIQDELLLDYVPLSQLHKESKKIIEQISFKAAPTKPRRYPHFFSHKPGYVPWFINELEARILLDDIRKSMRFSELMRDNPDLFDGRCSDEFPFWLESADEPLSVEKLTWQIVSPEPVSEKAIDPKDCNLAELTAIPQHINSVWELTAFHSNMRIAEGPRPYFPKMALGADANSGMILGFELNGPENTMAEAAAAGLIRCIRTTQARPGTACVASKNLAQALGPLADSLSIKLVQTKSLPMATEARLSLDRFGG